MPLQNLYLDDERACLLAVDDTPEILQLLAITLGIDYEIITAESGPQALALFQQHRFDLVLLDLLMPGMDGFATLAHLQQLPAFAGTPVVFLTAMDDLASECSALEMGADDYIVKPFKPNLVRLRIANILHRLRLQRHLSLALAGAEQGLWSWDLTRGEVRITTGWSQPLSVDGSTAATLVQGWAALAHPDCRATIARAQAAYLAGSRPAFEADVRLRTLATGWCWFNVHGKSAGPHALTGTYRNIDARKLAELALRESEERLRHLALFDALTGLPNRRLLVDRLSQAVVQNQRQATLGALMFIDMDHFKELNDTLGHDFGDLLLIEIGRRLQSCTRSMDTVARLGGDEFIVMLPLLAGDPATALRDAQTSGNKILATLGQPYRLGGHLYESTPSIGLTLFSGAAGESIDAILKRADVAMYAAKAQGRNRLALASLPPPCSAAGDAT